MNLLSNMVSFPWLLESGYEIGLNWLGKFAMVIIEGVGIIGLGIIVFTLVLKAITLPFDIYQRVKMRKQNLIMRQMQPELEKLQKQYANDKAMYNQKMMELYKKNGYSMLGACLPMIISLVILIVAFSGFRTYSQYANLSMYEKMSSEYNAAILENSADGVDYRLAQEGIDPSLVKEWEEGKTWTDEEKGVTYTMFAKENGDKFMRVVPLDEKKFLFYEYRLNETQTFVNRSYTIDVDRLLAIEGKQAEINAFVEEKKALDENYFKDELGNDDSQEEIYVKYLKNVGSSHVRDWYRDGNDSGFLWVKNVWYPDVSYNHPIQDYDNFKSQLNTTVKTRNGEEKSLSSVLSPEQYKALTEELSKEKDQANGYFILIILSIGLMVLSQFISMRSQKESNKYQTVDGKGATQQKMMLILMPLIYAVFAFMYSAAFSIYMVMSSAISIIVTLLSNLILGVVFKKKEEEIIREKYSRKLPWQQNGTAKKEKRENKKNKNNSNKRK